LSSLTNTVVVVCGPTAVGKTAFAIKLAQQLNTQIISADSRQCYKELNIGVAKPSAEELNSVYHYFINSHSIYEEVNAGVFEKYALGAAEKIFAQNKVAVMVGGTGLYIKAFSEGIDEIPKTPAEIRDELNNKYRNYGLDWLQSEVQKKDLAFWKVAEQQNPHRLIRALEVLQTSGKSITAFRSGERVLRPFNILKIGLELPRATLNNRVNFRVNEMVNNGLIAEVQSMVLQQHLKALQTVGYRELFDYLDGAVSKEQAVDKIKINTRQYAKRQMTWFKKDTSVKWFQAETVDVNDVVGLLDQDLNDHR
jgi:tRNA dimethylallyltransferase